MEITKFKVRFKELGHIAQGIAIREMKKADLSGECMKGVAKEQLPEMKKKYNDLIKWCEQNKK